MPVFISHRSLDDELARQVRDRLTHTHGIVCYLDDLDVAAGIANQTNRLTALILNRIAECTNVLALVTKNTQGSWWVPFEIGVARQAPRIITSFTTLSSIELPSFLTEWPVLRGTESVDHFARLYKQQAPSVKRAFVQKTGTASEGATAIDSFHRQLKVALGQTS